jgi:predicted GNAT family acetyltransferase
MVDRVEPLTPDLWPAFERLFGKNGACMGCWCMYWRLPRKEYDAARGDAAKGMMKRRVKAGPPPGVLAFMGEEAVGWLQIGPRADAPQWNTPRRVSAPLEPDDAEDEGVWAATCFFVKPGMRKQGVTDALLEGGIDFARGSGARVIEACPTEATGRMDSVSLYVGHAGVFRRAKFKEIARRKHNRPLMRLALRGASVRRSGR